ncbi:hypothetical protein FB45DRAFT_746888 [Roridomyces roridus]|uniref:YMC020W-like alpha/beta hydrolase domain-containing protein n=1 Tax=Roridomyces roridus TaxID=1738132 RepID=A0AAD7BU00_9AGAR|nr:hypothetical protein FB45DRAFT_746888 [Roridomyces roridus]
MTPKPSQQPVIEASEPPPIEPEEADNKTIRVDISQERASWYSPWAWYGPNPPPVPADGEHPHEEDVAETVAVDTSTEPPAASQPPVIAAASNTQERYWTSFFASSSNSQSHANIEPPSPEKPTSPEPVPKQEPPPPAPDPNPIGDTIDSNRSGWISFLSSTATLGYASRKTVTSGEPEVMEIDFDEESEGSTTAVPTPQTSSDAKDKTTQKAADGKDTPNGDVPADKPSKPAERSSKPAEKPPKSTAPPLTISDTVKRQVNNNSPSGKRSSSPAPSVASKASTGTKTPAKAPAPPRSPVPNWVLPTWQDTFHTRPRSHVPRRLLDGNGKTMGRAVVEKTMRFVSDVLFASDGTTTSRKASGGKGKGREDREQERRFEEWGVNLPRAWDVLKPAAGEGHTSEADEGKFQDVLRGCKHVVVIGVHGWFPGAVIQSVLGEPTGTSSKFVNMMVSALEDFERDYSVKFQRITRIPLEGEGMPSSLLYAALSSNTQWMADLHSADVIFVAAHSQGSVVSTHLIDRLIRDKHIRTGGSDVTPEPRRRRASSTSSVASVPSPPPQRVCLLALSGIHLGPLRYLSSSSFVQPYLQYFETTAARELFEFQNTESEVSKAYVSALQNVLDSGTKLVYVASLNDQVVPIYSGLFTAASHPLILRSLYIDGDAYHTSDFLSNLMVLLIRILNAGLPDSGLLNHLSEATAGSLNGVGHSTVYEEIANYTLAVKYLFLTNSGFDTHPELVVEPFNANTEQNDYEIPWSLRDLIADERVAHFFSNEISQLATAFRQWQPKTTILRDIKRKLQPIQRLPSSTLSNGPSPASVSKL